MQEKYETPVVEIVAIDEKDIIFSSRCGAEMDGEC